jgi:putative methionine-R-sulfoxide reductase with GAF domain
MKSWPPSREVNFVSLQTAIFCVQCELISENHTPHCYACGSRAVLSLSRVLGGSLRGQPAAHLIADAELDRLVRDLLHSLPSAPVPESERRFSHAASARHHVRALGHFHPSGASVLEPEDENDMTPVELDLEPAIGMITERAQVLTRATGAAIALRKGDEMVCRARAGRTAPDLGVRLQTTSGISAECVRTGEVLLCHDADRNPRVDLASCRRLGVRSILVAPLRHLRRTLGVFEVLSSSPYAFDHHDVAVMQMLSGLTVAALSRLAGLRQTPLPLAPACTSNS